MIEKIVWMFINSKRLRTTVKSTVFEYFLFVLIFYLKQLIFLHWLEYNMSRQKCKQLITITTTTITKYFDRRPRWPESSGPSHGGTSVSRCIRHVTTYITLSYPFAHLLILDPYSPEHNSFRKSEFFIAGRKSIKKLKGLYKIQSFPKFQC